MSRLNHNVLGIILMVIVAQSLPSSANNLNYYGKPYKVKDQCDSVFEPLSADKNDKGDPSHLFAELNKSDLTKSHDFKTPAKFYNTHKLEKSEENDKLAPWKNHSNGGGDENNEPDMNLRLTPPANRDSARQQEQRRLHYERIQNEAADRQFQQIMLKLKNKLQEERERVREETPNRTGDAKKYGDKGFLAKALHFHKQSKIKSRCKKPVLTTTTESPITLLTPPPTGPSCTESNDCEEKNEPKDQLEPQEVDHLLGISMEIKKQALLMIKNINLLEIEILSNWPDALPSDESEPMPTDDSQPKDYSETTNRPSTQNEDSSKIPERLDKPTSFPSTLTTRNYSRGYHFGFRPAGERDTEANIAASLQEERKLEQKVREEYQIQRKRTRSERRRQLIQQIRSKIKRARYETAPPAAARIEFVITKRPSVLVNNPRENQKLSQASQPGAVAYSPEDKLKMNALRNKLSENKIKRKTKTQTKAKRKLLASVMPKAVQESIDKKATLAARVRSKLQRHLSNQNKILRSNKMRENKIKRKTKAQTKAEGKLLPSVIPEAVQEFIDKKATLTARVRSKLQRQLSHQQQYNTLTEQLHLNDCLSALL